MAVRMRVLDGPFEGQTIELNQRFVP